jgi:hypothetical protein
VRVLDLFSGLRGWSEPWKERGHETFTVDIEPRFEPDLCIDMLNLHVEYLPWRPDVVLASPPCTTFTTMTMGRNWTHEGRPKTLAAATALALIWRTQSLIAQLRPAFYVIENPRARLRTLGLLDTHERRTVWYCRYGEERAKPTDLWGGFPPTWVARPGCRNGHPDHIPAPRGSRSGTQGNLESAVLAKIPSELSLDICLAAEHDLMAMVA